MRGAWSARLGPAAAPTASSVGATLVLVLGVVEGCAWLTTAGWAWAGPWGVSCMIPGGKHAPDFVR